MLRGNATKELEAVQQAAAEAGTLEMTRDLWKRVEDKARNGSSNYAIFASWKTAAAVFKVDDMSIYRVQVQVFLVRHSVQISVIGLLKYGGYMIPSVLIWKLYNY